MMRFSKHGLVEVTAKNCLQNVPKSFRNRSEIVNKSSNNRPEIMRISILGRSWTIFGASSVPTMAPRIDFGSMLERLWLPFREHLSTTNKYCF